jgi:hypothetical protein
VFVCADRALFIGDRSETSLHSHHAIELRIALDDRGIAGSAPRDASLIGILNDIKSGMIAEATRNARESAEQFAADSRSRIIGTHRATQVSLLRTLCVARC